MIAAVSRGRCSAAHRRHVRTRPPAAPRGPRRRREPMRSPQSAPPRGSHEPGDRASPQDTTDAPGQLRGCRTEVVGRPRWTDLSRKAREGPYWEPWGCRGPSASLGYTRVSESVSDRPFWTLRDGGPSVAQLSRRVVLNAVAFASTWRCSVAAPWRFEAPMARVPPGFRGCRPARPGSALHLEAG